MFFLPLQPAYDMLEFGLLRNEFGMVGSMHPCAKPCGFCSFGSATAEDISYPLKEM